MSREQETGSAYAEDERLADRTPIAQNALNVESIEQELAKVTDQKAAKDAATIMTEVVKAGDIDRLMTGATLINAFNFAIQQQGKRDQWTANDYRAFCIALGAMDTLS